MKRRGKEGKYDGGRMNEGERKRGIIGWRSTGEG